MQVFDFEEMWYTAKYYRPGAGLEVSIVFLFFLAWNALKERIESLPLKSIMMKMTSAHMSRVLPRLLSPCGISTPPALASHRPTYVLTEVKNGF